MAPLPPSKANRYQVLICEDPLPILVFRVRDGKVMFVNPAAEYCLNIDTGENRSLDARKLFAPQSRNSGFMEQLLTCCKTECFEVRMIARTGEPFWAEVTVKPLLFDGDDCVFLTLTDVTARKTMEDQLRRMAETDSLTGLWNRRKFIAELEQEQERVERYMRPCSVLSIDVDHFKGFNDSCGHGAGDQAKLCGRNTIVALETDHPYQWASQYSAATPKSPRGLRG
tara:strand:- start:26962 stop:27639 length:678 start_codon:yes stop_codon:yes gene_type:complete